MRKLIFIILAVSILSGSVYALFPGLFPNTSTFPRIPAWDGTIGWVIEAMIKMPLDSPALDGTVANTQKLGGRTATGYLGTRWYCPPGQVYTSISATSQGICTNKWSSLLTDLGRIVSGSGIVNIYHASGSISTPSTYPYIVQSWDIIDTPPGGEATVIFTDDSVLRLDSDTTLALDAGSLSGGTSIASILLESGQVWWRILTLTGSYTVGSRDIVAWVRGTSISLAKTGATSVTLAYDSARAAWNPTITGTQYPSSLSIVHTSLTTPYAADISCSDGRSLAIRSGESITSSGICPLSATSTPVSTLFANAWINSNTQEDLRYMLTLRTLSGSLWAGIISLAGWTAKDLKVASEIIATNPATLAEERELCKSGESWYPDYGCQPAGLLAIADYTRGDTKFYKVEGSTYPPIDPLTTSSYNHIKNTDYVRNGVEITTNGQYISYAPSEILWLVWVSSLAWKTIIIETSSIPSGTHTLLALWLTIGWTNIGNVTISAWWWVINCIGYTSCTNLGSRDKPIWSIKIPPSALISQAFIGGTSVGSQLSWTIKKIIIK